MLSPQEPLNQAVVRTNPFSLAHHKVDWVVGQTLAEIMLDSDLDYKLWPATRVCINGEATRHEYWHRIYPKAGAHVTVAVQPQGDTLSFIGALFLNPMIAIGAITLGVAADFLSGLFIPQLPEMDNGSKDSQSLSVAGARNKLAPFGVKPIVLGIHKFFPYYAAQPVTSLRGDDQYVTMLFVLGQHNVEVSNASIGPTDLSLYDEVQVEYDTGGSLDSGSITLYQDIIRELDIDKLLLRSASEVIYAAGTTEPLTEYITYDIVFPQGLIKVQNDGDRKKLTVTVVVEQSTNGINWSPVKTHSFTAKSNSAIRQGYSYSFGTPGTYTIRMSRTTNDNHDTGSEKDSRTFDDVYFSKLRSFISSDPVNDDDWSAIAVEIKATDQLSGQVDEFNVLASSIIPDWNGSASWITRVSNNPASLARWVLTGPANPRPLALSRLDSAAFEYFHEFCTAKGFTYNKVIDYDVNVWALFTEICYAGRARPLVIDGIFTVRVDEAQNVPHQIFSPRNSRNFSGLKSFPDIPHALRCRYIDEDGDYSNDEQIVYDDGYDSGTATIFNSAEFKGVTYYKNIFKMARYRLAAIRLQPERIDFESDFEQLAVLPSDRIEYQSDVILVGLGSARVILISNTHVTLDAEMPMTGLDADGQPVTYSVQFRHADLTTTTLEVVTEVPGQDVLEFAIPQGSPPAVIGDLIIFGETGRLSLPLLIKNIRSTADMSAVLECLPYDPALYTADTGPIPDYNPVLTPPPGSRFPSIIQVRSGEAVMTLDASGSWQVRVLIDLGFPQNRGEVHEIIIQARIWEGGANETVPWITHATLPGDSKEVSLFGYTTGDEIQIRARYVFPDGLSSTWVLWYESDGSAYHTVVGKLTLPPAPDILNVTLMSDGTRYFTYGYSDPTVVPPDFFGVIIRYLDTDLMTGDPISFDLMDGTNSFHLMDPAHDFILMQTNLTPQWDQMTDFRGGRITETGYEANSPGQGDWFFAIKAIDDGGRQSADAHYEGPITLPIPRKGNNLAYRSEWTMGWGQNESPGATISWATVDAVDGFLYTNAQTTLWSDMPTWDTFGTWGGLLETQVVFQQDDDFRDFETPTRMTWALRWTVDTATSVIAEINVGVTTPGDQGWVTWVDGTVYDGRYFAFRLTINAPGVIAAKEFIQEAFVSA